MRKANNELFPYETKRHFQFHPFKHKKNEMLDENFNNYSNNILC